MLETLTLLYRSFATFAFFGAFAAGCASPSTPSPTSETNPVIPPGGAAEQATAPDLGPARCKEGFSRQDGRCVAILPETECTGPTRAALGQTGCVPVGDCEAPFPSGAIVVTDPARLQETLASARPGSVIALEPGTYPGVTIDKSLTLVGRCPAEVVFDGGGKGRGIDIKKVATVGLRSLAIAHFDIGVAVPTGVSEPVVLEANQIYVSKNRIAIDVHGKATIRESVVEGISSTTTDVAGVWAAEGGSVELTDFESRGTMGGILSVGAGSTVTAQRSVLGYTGAVRDIPLVAAVGGGQLNVVESALRTRAASIILSSRTLSGKSVGLQGKGGTVRVVDSELATLGSSADAHIASVGEEGHLKLESTSVVYEVPTAIHATKTASVEVEGSTFLAIPNADHERTAFYVSLGAYASVKDSLITHSYRTAALVGRPGSRFVLDHSRIEGTRPGVSNQGTIRMGFGVAAMDDAEVSIVDSQIVDTEGSAVYAGEASVSLTRTTIDGVRATSARLTGLGAMVEGGSLVMRGSRVRGCEDAAVAFFGGAGLVDKNQFQSCPVGIHAQDVKIVRLEQERPHEAGELVLVGNTFESIGDELRREPIDLGQLNAQSSSRR